MLKKIIISDSWLNIFLAYQLHNYNSSHSDEIRLAVRTPFFMTTLQTTLIDPELSSGEEILAGPLAATSARVPTLEYTGERMVPETNRGQVIYVEHLARYMFAAQFAVGKTVLDFGSGEGYGASILVNHGAASVHGIDISPLAIEHARIKYPHESIKFICADCLSTPLEDNSFELATSFEVIEHLTDHAGYIGEVCRLLKDDGILIISTPNLASSDGSNSFHVKELSLNDFSELLQANFTSVKIFAQTDLICSMVYDTKDRGQSSFLLETVDPLPDLPDNSYFLAVCSNNDNTVSVKNSCIASTDEEYPRLDNILKETRKAVDDQIIIIREQEKLIGEKDNRIASLLREREELLTVVTSYREMLPHINKAQASLRKDAISVESRLELAHICLAVNINDSARWYFSQVLQQEPDHVAALFQMGQLYAKTGKPALAREYYNKILLQDIHHPEAIALIAAIENLVCHL